MVNPFSFPEVGPNTSTGLQWTATNVTAPTDHGTYKLFLCPRRGLAMWVPSGDWFVSNQIPQANQTIAQLAEKRSKAKVRPKPYDRPDWNSEEFLNNPTVGSATTQLPNTDTGTTATTTNTARTLHAIDAEIILNTKWLDNYVRRSSTRKSRRHRHRRPHASLKSFLVRVPVVSCCVFSNPLCFLKACCVFSISYFLFKCHMDLFLEIAESWWTLFLNKVKPVEANISIILIHKIQSALT